MIRQGNRESLLDVLGKVRKFGVKLRNGRCQVITLQKCAGV